MNWLIRKKMHTYFYNNFSPVNRVHYIKCGVNSSLLMLFWLLHKVCGTLDHCFIMTHIIHKEGDLQIYFCVIFLETRHHAQAHITSGAFIHCALSLAARRTQMAAELGWRFRWPVLIMATLESQNIFCSRTWSSNPSGGGTILALSSFLNQIPHQKEPEISVGIFSPTWR
jgi:hypothetical protein